MDAPPLSGTATADDVRDLERHEVVGGELVQKAAPSGDHSAIQFGLGGTLFVFRGPGGGEGKPGGWWFGTEAHIELETHEVYVPDLAGWRIDRVPMPPRGMPVRVVPDWVCEILSPSTAARDLGHKQRIYHRARIGHYWIIDPGDQVLTVYRWHEAGYILALAAGAGDAVRAEPFDGIELDIASVFGPLTREE